MATETQTAPAAPELTVLHRVASIPLINDSLSAVHNSLSSNAYTRSPYNTAQALSSTAIRYSEPIASRLAPLIVRADGFANKAVDAVESRYPYPFKTPTDEIIHDLKERSDHAKEVANKTLDDRVRTPAATVAQGIDQRFAPLMDYIEAAVSRLNNGQTSASPSAEQKYQYQRAFALSKDLKDQVYEYSNEQLKLLQSHSVLVQRATETAHNISNLATSSLGAAQAKVHSMSDTMVQELQKIQASTSALPAHLQASFKPVQEGIQSTITDLSTVLKSEIPLNEKVTKLGDTVQERVKPVLEAATVRVQETIKAVTASAKKEGNDVKENVPVNGNGAAH
ncbi:hypothetical protein EVG20_g5908 [Dentipellis fragilis]|uniref:Lipid droplet-associated perilipin protein n=1 Tax=Dentipellis fragilis TaxID=205917 RepID=A0A4Y9YU02_9AGAM|nr:hypothetical protein EVG20_g5908 [Dentipellis fragilis]